MGTNASAQADAGPANFHCLKERIRLEGRLTTRTGLRIGGGGGATDGVDLPVLRDGDNYPFIPGSSLKGVLRSTVEALLRGSEREDRKRDFWACDPFDKDPTLECCGRHGSGAGNRLKALQQPHCAVCQLFGSPVLASHVRISDALLFDAETLKRDGRLPVERRDGVAIDRDLRKVHGNQKYDFEVVAPGTKFALEIFVENPVPWQMGLLVIGLDQLKDGFSAIGGFTSRGLGRVDLEWQALSHCKAEALLAGEPAKTLTNEGLTTRIEEYRTALAQYYATRQQGD